MENLIFWLIAVGAAMVIVMALFRERLEFRTKEMVEKCRDVLWQKDLFNLGAMSLTKEVFIRLLPQLSAAEYNKLKQDLVMRRTSLQTEEKISDKQRGVLNCIDTLLELMHDYETERANIH